MARKLGTYYVLTPNGPIAGIKVWPKRRKSGGLDIEIKYGCLDQKILENKPLKFEGKTAARACGQFYSCFGGAFMVATEADVRNWMEDKEKQRAEAQKEYQEAQG